MSNIKTMDLPSPSFLHGWKFLKFVGTTEPEALPVQVVGNQEYPTILINTDLVSLNDLELSFSAMIWVPLVLQNLTSLFILEALDSENDIGFYNSAAWAEFRELICLHTNLTWDEFLDLAEIHGLDHMTEFAVSSVFIESGLQSAIFTRNQGASALKLMQNS